MLRRYSLPILAIVGLTLGGQVRAEAVRHDAGRHPSPQQRQTKPEADAPPVIPVATQNDIKRIAGALESANDKQPSSTDKRNADAQERVADWTPWLFAVGLFETLVTAGGVWLVYHTLVHTRRAADAAADAVKEAKEATKATRETGEAQVRAYLHIKSVGVTFHQGIGAPTFMVTIVNTGQSPARNFVCGVQIIYNASHMTANSLMPPDWEDALGKAIPAGGEEQLSIDVHPIVMSPKADAYTKADDFGAIMRAKIIFKYCDVFGKEWDGDAYFVGHVSRKGPRDSLSVFDNIWKAELNPVARPQQWNVEAANQQDH